MRYEDMVFTDNDKSRLKENRDAICSWIMENIVPFMDEDDTLRIDFGPIYRCPRTGTRIETYHLAVYGRKHNFYFMGDRGSGFIGYGEKFGGLYDPFEKVCSPYEIFPVVDNWKMIKRRLLGMAGERKAAKKSIYTFEV